MKQHLTVLFVDSVFAFRCIRKAESSPKFKGPQYPVFSHRSLYDRVLSGTHSKALDAREFLGQFWEGCSGTAQDELGGGCGRQEVGCGRHSEGIQGTSEADAWTRRRQCTIVFTRKSTWKRFNSSAEATKTQDLCSKGMEVP